MQEESRRLDIPVAWLRAVMRAESDGDTKYVSDKGAIGLTQLMPATYQEPRVEHGLGTDSFDPRDNISAGAAYLAEIFGSCGSNGFLAAYNSGLRRNQEHRRGRPLPSQIVDYVADVAPRLGFEVPPTGPMGTPINALAAPIFFAALAPEASSGWVSLDSSSSKKAALHPLFPAHSDDKRFADERRSIGTSVDAKAAASVQAANLFVARSAQVAP